MVKAFPLNQQEYSYNAQDVSYYYAGRHSGVFALDTNCQVSIVSNMTIKVAKGKGWLAHGVDYGVVFWMEDDVLLTVPVGDVASPRWDYVVVGWETKEVKNNPTIYIKSGSPTVTPAEPTLENSVNKIEICLAKIYVPSGTTNLRATGVTLTDTREDKNYCGLVGDDLRTTNLEERATSLEERATSIENRTTSLEGRASDSETEINKIKNGTTSVGEAEKAKKLTTARNINGTIFDGTQDITTARWGNERSFTIDSIEKIIDGSSNIAFSTINIQEETIAYNGTYTDGGVTKKGEKKLLILKCDGNSSLYIQKQSIRQLVLSSAGTASQYRVSYKLLETGTGVESIALNPVTGYGFAFIIGV